MFAFMLLILTINCISKKSIGRAELTDTIIETNNEIVDESTTSDTPNISDIETDIKTEVEVETDTEIEVETNIEPETKVEIEPFFYLDDYERWVAECVVMGESGAESYNGQVLVAQCLLNGCIKEGLKPSELRIKYKYSGWNENPTDSVEEAVSAVFDDGYKITDEFILYFYAPRYSKGKWHETQKFVIEEGNHRFFTGWN